MKLEADDFCTSVITSTAVRRSATEEPRFALVMGNEDADVRLFFFVTKEMVHGIITSLVDMVGRDS